MVSSFCLFYLAWLFYIIHLLPSLIFTNILLNALWSAVITECVDASDCMGNTDAEACNTQTNQCVGKFNQRQYIITIRGQAN